MYWIGLLVQKYNPVDMAKGSWNFILQSTSRVRSKLKCSEISTLHNCKMKRQLKYSVLQYVCSTGNLELISTQQMIGTAAASFHACHMGSHNVTCHPTQVNKHRLNPNQWRLVLDLLPQWDERLSWPRWLDYAPAGSWTRNHLIASLTLYWLSHRDIQCCNWWSGIALKSDAQQITQVVNYK